MDNNQAMESEQLAELFYTTKHFWKCYMKDFLAVMKALSYKQFEVFIYILENVKPGTNLFIATPSKIEKNTGCCRQTVAKTMKILQDQDFIRKIQTGVWMINPDILIKGNGSKQAKLCEDYEKAGLTEETEKEDGKDDSGKQEKHKEVCEDSCGKTFQDTEEKDIKDDSGKQNQGEEACKKTSPDTADLDFDIDDFDFTLNTEENRLRIHKRYR